MTTYVSTDVNTESSLYNLNYDGTFSPQRLILQIGHKSTITLAAIYAYTARHLRLHTESQPSSALIRKESREHQRLLRLLRDELSKPDAESFPMGTLTGICGIILAKVELPEKVRLNPRFVRRSRIDAIF